jgi:hypothetical protein
MPTSGGAPPSTEDTTIDAVYERTSTAGRGELMGRDPPD